MRLIINIGCTLMKEGANRMLAFFILPTIVIYSFLMYFVVNRVLKAPKSKTA